MVEDLSHSGWPSTSSTEANIAEVKEMVTENRHLSLREITAELSMFHESIRTILNDFLGMKQLLYSPAMAPADFFLFPKLKLPLQGTRFQSIEDIKENSRRELKSIPENSFNKCFNDWINRWHKCILSVGAYFECDKINLDE